MFKLRRENIRYLNRIYMLVFTVMAGLLVLSQLIVQLELAGQDNHAVLINLASRQRMVSQHISKDAFLVTFKQLHPQYGDPVVSLETHLNNFEQAQLDLVQGDAALGLEPTTSPTILAMLEAIRPIFEVILGAGRCIVRIERQMPLGGCSADLATQRFTIINNEAYFLHQMDAIVAAYVADAQTGVNRVQVSAAALFLVELLVLALLGVWVIRPATLQIEKLHQRELADEQHYHLLADYATDMIARHTAAGIYTYVSPAAQPILGYEPAEMVGKSIHAFFHPEDVEQAHIELLSTQEVVTLVYRFRRKDGSYIWFETTSQPVRHQITGEIKELVTISRDITQRKQAEADLRLAQQAAERANRAKSIFLANMSHELRTPLNAILGFAQLLAREASPQQRSHLDTILSSGEHLLSVINNVLEISKIEAGQLTLNPREFDLRQMLTDLEAMLGLRAKAKNLRLTFEGVSQLPAQFFGDEVKLRQVLLNLLNNALKFTSEGGVALRVRYERLVDMPLGDAELPNAKLGRLLWEVQDTGMGIAPEEMESLFQAFAQTSSGRQTQEGSGLGLAISRDYVRLMGGNLTVQSEAQKGSLFKFDLAILEVPPPTVEITPSSLPHRRVIGIEEGQTRYKILVVEDRYENRRLMVKLMQEMGFEVREAANGQEAVEVNELWQPALIWMDMDMPIMDGREATQLIKANGREVVVIALTASAFDYERQAILRAGCDDFMTKPFRIGDIYNLMAQHLGVRFRYAEASPTAPLPPPSQDKLPPPPAHLLPQLKGAALTLDTAQMEQLIQQLEATHAQALREMLKQFRFDKIQAWVEEWEKQT